MVYPAHLVIPGYKEEWLALKVHLDHRVLLGSKVRKVTLELEDLRGILV